MRRAIQISAVAAAMMLLAACATGGKSPAAGAQTAGERAVARWQAIIDRKAELAYDYLTPGVRSSKTREGYASEQTQKPLTYLSVALDDEDCAADACTVRVELQYELAIPIEGITRKRFPAFVEERWVRIDGSWFLLPDAYR